MNALRFLLIGLLILSFCTGADSHGRSGCHRAGGINSHGLGSHYVCDSSSGGDPQRPPPYHTLPAATPPAAAPAPSRALPKALPNIEITVRDTESRWRWLENEASSAWGSLERWWDSPQPPAPARTPRNPRERRAFQSAFACPANGARRGACPGFVVDHIKPLCLGGADSPWNMQWQASALALEKDRLEWAACRASR